MRTVVLIAFDGLQLLDLAGPAEAFDAASRVPGPSREPYRIVVATPDGGAVRCSSGMRISGDIALQNVRARGLDTVIVGGAVDVADIVDRRVVAALERLSRGARRTCSVCTGAYALGAAGLLDGRRATTHWAYGPQLAAAFPRADVQPDRIFVRDGAIATSAGSSAGIDLALALIEEDHGAQLARTVARWLVMFLQRPGGQSQFSERLTLPVVADPRLREVLDEIAGDPAGDHRQAQLARRAAVSERHLRRVFAQHTGTTPARYVERIRVEAARDELQGGGATVEAIARRCGFGSPETMRRAFIRILGVGPAEYRGRFATSAG